MAPLESEAWLGEVDCSEWWAFHYVAQPWFHSRALCFLSYQDVTSFIIGTTSPLAPSQPPCFPYQDNLYPPELWANINVASLVTAFLYFIMDGKEMSTAIPVHSSVVSWFFPGAGYPLTSSGLVHQLLIPRVPWFVCTRWLHSVIKIGFEFITLLLGL